MHEGRRWLAGPYIDQGKMQEASLCFRDKGEEKLEGKKQQQLHHQVSEPSGGMAGLITP